MKIIKIINDIQKIRKTLKGRVGFVPTMGYLHDGHLSLVKLAKKENDYVVVHIFVNPKQFGPHEDFRKYPRDTERDLKLLKKAGVDLVFLPEVNEFYPIGYETYVNIDNISKKLEGKIRPGHFSGVATVLIKLFNIIQPEKVYLGQKDAQQVIVVKKMVNDLNIPAEIVVGETIREKDGLAMSSRNVFLSPEERKEAIIIYKSLYLAEKMFKNGEKNAEKIKSEMKKLINTTRGVIDYISVANPDSLEERKFAKKGDLVSLAVRFGKTRLIDNIFLKH